MLLCGISCGEMLGWSCPTFAVLDFQSGEILFRNACDHRSDISSIRTSPRYHSNSDDAAHDDGWFLPSINLISSEYPATQHQPSTLQWPESITVSGKRGQHSNLRRTVYITFLPIPTITASSVQPQSFLSTVRNGFGLGFRSPVVFESDHRVKEMMQVEMAKSQPCFKRWCVRHNTEF